MIDPIYDEIDQLLSKPLTTPNGLNPFNGNSLTIREISLPTDFNSLIKYVSPFINGSCNINIDFADFNAVCKLDLDKKICKDGHLLVLETTCDPKNIDSLKSTLCKFDNCADCLLMVSSDYDFDYYTMEKIASIFQNYLLNGNTVTYSLKKSANHDIEFVKIQAILRITKAVA